MRSRETPRPETSWWFLLIFFISALIFGWYILFIGRGIDLEYDQTAAQDEKTATADMKKIDLGNETPLYIPTLSVFRSNQPWMYVTKSSPLPSTYEPQTLTPLDVATGASESVMQLRESVSQQLSDLFEAAEADGYTLMVSSAYRSVTEQQKLYDSMKKARGAAYADQYVLTPGASEHHTGFAVDITDASAACKKDSDDCILSPATAAWLEENAPDFGFIIRYPSGKESITGISHEPWHLRYIGVVLARQLTTAGLTLDEFIEQVAPGRVK
jgi:D-alanyl-D-alanine carboxypeptidase